MATTDRESINPPIDQLMAVLSKQHEAEQSVRDSLVGAMRDNLNQLVTPEEGAKAEEEKAEEVAEEVIAETAETQE